MERDRPRTEETVDALEGIDTWHDAKILDTLLAGQERAIAAARAASPKIAEAATVLSERLAAGGRLIYAGAGASIRIAVQDGSELPATFGFPEDRIAYLIAGGREAMFETLADAEDDTQAGTEAAMICRRSDTLIAVAASGTTPFTVAAAQSARERGCIVIAMVNNRNSLLGRLADIEILLDSGPEVIAGSTRLGAGTAQKAALNLLSTLTFIKLGAVHDSMMVNVQAGNAKLRRRAAVIVSKIAGASESEALKALDQTGGEVKPAVLLCAGADVATVQNLLADTRGNLRQALSRLRSTP